MNESEIKKLIKEYAEDEKISDEDMIEILEILKQKKIFNKEKLFKLFKELDKRKRLIIWDDSEDVIENDD